MQLPGRAACKRVLVLCHSKSGDNNPRICVTASHIQLFMTIFYHHWYSWWFPNLINSTQMWKKVLSLLWGADILEEKKGGCHHFFLFCCRLISNKSFFFLEKFSRQGFFFFFFFFPPEISQEIVCQIIAPGRTFHVWGNVQGKVWQLCADSSHSLMDRL